MVFGTTLLSLHSQSISVYVVINICYLFNELLAVSIFRRGRPIFGTTVLSFCLLLAIILVLMYLYQFINQSINQFKATSSYHIDYLRRNHHHQRNQSNQPEV